MLSVKSLSKRINKIHNLLIKPTILTKFYNQEALMR